MGSGILILYSTVDGHTRKICERLQQVLERAGHRVTLASIADQPNLDLSPFDKIVIGASIRYGKHRPQVADFMNARQRWKASRTRSFRSMSSLASPARTRRRPILT